MAIWAVDNGLISRQYLDLLIDMHALAPWGTKGFKYFEEIEKYADNINAKSILDYGCGVGTLGDVFLNVRPDIRFLEYDVAFDNMLKFAQVDLVVSTDVIEHIEPERLIRVIKHMTSLANVGFYFVIALKIAKRNLPNGENAHLIVRSYDWWMALLRKELEDTWHLDYEKHKSLRVIGRRK